jgi:hypothetical protein
MGGNSGVVALVGGFYERQRLPKTGRSTYINAADFFSIEQVF